MSHVQHTSADATTTKQNTNSIEEEKNIAKPDAIPTWLSCKFRLDKFNNKEQTFTITARINIFFQMDRLFDMSTLHGDDNPIFHSPNSNYQPSIKKISSIRNLSLENSTPINHLLNVDDIGKTMVYSNNWNEKIIKIVNLKQSALSFYLPINATKIFDSTQLHSIHHNENAALYYNKKRKLAHIVYNVTATLFEHLDLADFPFDRQFLHIKLKWNSIYYHLLNWSNTKDKQIGAQLLSDELSLYHSKPLTVCVCQELRSEIDMLQPWIDLTLKQQSHDLHDSHAQFAVIRLRINRNPTNFCLTVLVPFFIIVSCSFAIFAIESDAIGDRLVVSVTILLTFTAFQSMVDDELPQTSDTHFIDKYILIAYGIQGLIISGVCLLPKIVDSISIDQQNRHQIYWFIEAMWMSFIVIIWITTSICYVLKAKNVLKDENNDDAFWEKRAKHQKEHWIKANNEQTTFREFSLNAAEKPVYNKMNIQETYKSPLIQT